MPKTEEAIIPTLARTVQELNRKYGANTIGQATKMEHLQIGRIPTGIASLDEGLGGGLPIGRMVELYGPEHSGKSLISLLTVASAQKMGKDIVYVDVEGSFDAKWATMLGVDVSKVFVTQIGVAEDIIDMLAKLLESRPGVIVIDSVAAMIPREELEKGADENTMAIKARLMSRGLAKLNVLNKESSTLMIWVNQLRSTLAMFGNPITTPGGMALKHWASIRAEIRRDSQLLTESGKKTDKNYIGQTVNWKIVKNKTATPYKLGSFRYMFDGRIE